MTASLRYVYKFNLATTTADTSAGQVPFALNSCFQPNSGGHQPYGFDQLAALYYRYKVEAVSIKATFRSSEPLVTAYAAIFPPNNSVDIGGLANAPQILGEKPGIWCIPLDDGGNRDVVEWKRTYKMHQLVGVTPTQFASDLDSFCATVGANPVLMPYAVFTMSSGAATSSCRVNIEIVYHTTFYNRIIQTYSG